MKQIKMSNNLEISQVVVGCMRVKDSGMNEQEFNEFIRDCMEMGCDTFDHAPVYGGYTCEGFFGDAVLKKAPELRTKMKIITKTGITLPNTENNKVIYYNSTRENILREVESSLMKLGTDYIDLLLVHRPDPLANPEETADVLERLMKEGKILNAGVSNYMPHQVDALQCFMNTKLVTNQMELSVKNVDNFFNGVTDHAFSRRMPLMSWSPLGGGSMFAGENEQSIRIMKCLEEIASIHNVAVDVIMYAWLFTHPVNIAAITGSMNIERIKSAVDATKITLSYDEWYQILAASRGYDVP